MIRVCCLVLIFTLAAFAQGFSSRYEMLTVYADNIAQHIIEKIHEKDLSEAQIYTYLSSIVAYDNRIWSATLSFSPSFFKQDGLEDWWSADGWKSNQSKSKKALYAPYVWRSMDNILAASDIGDISSSFGYDYTDEKWDWWFRTLHSQKPTWTGPYNSSLTGHSMVSYSVPIEKYAVLSFNVWYNT